MKEDLMSSHSWHNSRLHRFQETPQNCHLGAFLYFHKVLDGKQIHKHVVVSDVGESSL